MDSRARLRPHARDNIAAKREVSAAAERHGGSDFESDVCGSPAARGPDNAEPPGRSTGVRVVLKEVIDEPAPKFQQDLLVSQTLAVDFEHNVLRPPLGGDHNDIRRPLF